MKDILGNTIVNILLLIFFPIVGLITMWVFTGWNLIVKIIVSVVLAGYIIIMFDALMSLF